jgi:predicted  nucleic acid-binding Zn-ribbon protein
MLIGSLFAGCSESKVSQCQRLIAEVNRGTSLVDHTKGKQSEGALKLAKDLDEVTKAIADINLQDEELKKYQSQFVKVFESMTKSIDKAAKALDSAKKAEITPAGRRKINKAKKDIESSFKSANDAAKQADNLAVEVNGYCTANNK